MFFNQLIEVQRRTTDGGTLEEDVDCQYDAYGNRLRKIVDENGDGDVDYRQRYGLDGWNSAKPAPVGNENWDVWADLNGGYNLQTRYLRGDVVDQLFARIRNNGQAFWYFGDHLGSIRDITDNSGVVKDSLTYDGFGNITAETDPDFRGRYAWTGREFDTEIDLQYNRARYYDAKIGRWISQDPLGFEAGDGNLYRYVYNAPTSMRDPTGLDNMATSEVWNPFGLPRRLFFKLSAKIDEGTLTIKVLEQKGIQQMINEWNASLAPKDKHTLPFDSIVAGAHTGDNASYQDTDSLQVAVRWGSANQTDIAHKTNALAVGLRPKGAIWAFDGKSPKAWATWTDQVPQGATCLNVILVYTDTIWGPPSAFKEKDNRQGRDLPLIIGSFSAKREHGNWKIEANSDDLADLGGYPGIAKYPEIIAQVRNTLMAKTGYELSARPAGLLPTLTAKQAEEIINAAVKKRINTSGDTGFDIVLR